MQFQFYSETQLPQVNQAVADFVSELIWGEPNRFIRFCTMAVVSNDNLVAGVVYHGWQPETAVMEISCAALNRKWMNRKVINAAISMPFDVMKCQAICAHHAESNKSARHIWNGLGADEYVIPRLRGRDEAEVLAVLTEEQWAVSPFNTQEKVF